MKFIMFWEWKPEDFDKVLEKSKQEMEMGPEKFAKVISGGYFFAGETKGFTLVETEDVEKLWSWPLLYSPEITYRFVPITETSKVAELYLKKKKA